MSTVYIEMYVSLDTSDKDFVQGLKEYLGSTPGLIQYDFVKETD